MEADELTIFLTLIVRIIRLNIFECLDQLYIKTVTEKKNNTIVMNVADRCYIEKDYLQRQYNCNYTQGRKSNHPISKVRTSMLVIRVLSGAGMKLHSSRYVCRFSNKNLRGDFWGKVPNFSL